MSFSKCSTSIPKNFFRIWNKILFKV